MSAVLSGVTIEGVEPDALYPGWTAVSRHTFAGGLDVLLLQEAGGREACWWVDHESGAYRGSHVLALNALDQGRFLTALDPVFLPIATGVLGGAPKDIAAALPAGVPQIALLEAAGTWNSRHEPNVMLLPTGHADSGEALTCPDGRKIGAGRMRALLGSRRTGESLVLASPFSEIPLRAQLTMRCGGLTAYRFQDPVDNVVFYLVWNEGRSDLRPSFYYPAGALLVSDDPAAPFIPANLLVWFATHAGHAEELRNARPFLPHDFGVGRASSLRQGGGQERTRGEVGHSSRPAEQPTRADAVPEKPDVQSPPSFARPSFLPDIPDAPPAPEKDPGMMGRLKRLFGNKTQR